MTPAIEIYGLRKDFRTSQGFGKPSKRFTVLDQIDLKVESGKIFALLGPNGAGKTTLIKILCTLIIPDLGGARICGTDVLRDPENTKKHISLVVGEERSFYWRLTGRQNLEFFAALYGLKKKEARRKIDDAASLFEIDFLDRRYQEYSAGMKQHLALARSLLNDASVIFMDEPTRSLDPAAAARFKAMIKKFVVENQRTIFFATHRLDEVEELADTVAILDQGKVRLHTSVNELRLTKGDSGVKPWLEGYFLQPAVAGVSCQP